MINRGGLVMWIYKGGNYVEKYIYVVLSNCFLPFLSNTHTYIHTSNLENAVIFQFDVGKYFWCYF